MACRNNEILETVLDTLAQQGARDIHVEQARHIKVLYTAPDGRKLMKVVARSPSDYRSMNRAVADVKRQCRRRTGEKT